MCSLKQREDPDDTGKSLLIKGNKSGSWGSSWCLFLYESLQIPLVKLTSELFLLTFSIEVHCLKLDKVEEVIINLAQSHRSYVWLDL